MATSLGKQILNWDSRLTNGIDQVAYWGNRACGEFNLPKSVIGFLDAYQKSCPPELISRVATLVNYLPIKDLVAFSKYHSLFSTFSRLQAYSTEPIKESQLFSTSENPVLRENKEDIMLRTQKVAFFLSVATSLMNTLVVSHGILVMTTAALTLYVTAVGIILLSASLYRGIFLDNKEFIKNDNKANVNQLSKIVGSLCEIALCVNVLRFNTKSSQELYVLLWIRGFLLLTTLLSNLTKYEKPKNSEGESDSDDDAASLVNKIK